MDSNEKNISSSRDRFSSKPGFILACIGSAVGMGNIWLFPYRVGQFGGAAFLIPYFIFVLLLGFTGVIGEMALGRAMGAGPLGAFEQAFEKRGHKKIGTVLGLIPVVGSFGIAVGYSVVIGWVLRYLVGCFSGAMLAAENTGAYFGAIAGSFGSIPWHIAALGLTFIMMLFGISKGIEKVNKILMPAFFCLFLILAVRVFFLPNANLGYAYLLRPDWTLLQKPETWIYALGQAFFSLSLAGSGTVVYGSYLKREENIVSSAKYVAFFDTCAAILAAFVIIPAVFAYGLEPSSGPPLMFITLPSVFQNMPMGGLFSLIFFAAVLCAGITSLMNLYETPVEALQNKFGISRKTAICIIALLGFAVGIFIEGDLLNPWMDVVSIYAIPLGALLSAIVLFWVCGSRFAREAAQQGCDKPLGSWFEPMTKYVFVGITLAVYILGIFYGGIG